MNVNERDVPLVLGRKVGGLAKRQTGQLRKINRNKDAVFCFHAALRIAKVGPTLRAKHTPPRAALLRNRNHAPAEPHQLPLGKRHAACRLLLPKKETLLVSQPIILGIDFSTCSKKASQVAFALGKALNTDVVGVHAIDPLVAQELRRVFPDDGPHSFEGKILNDAAAHAHRWLKDADVSIGNVEIQIASANGGLEKCGGRPRSAVVGSRRKRLK